jgi:tetratricopeptide (TPR) repeat protein
MKSNKFFSIDSANYMREQDARLKMLEAKMEKLLSTPEHALVTIAVESYKEGKLDKAIQFSESALKLNPNAFNCAKILVSNYQDIAQLTRISDLMTQAIILVADPVENDQRLELGNYYKTQALKKVEAFRHLSALALFESALQCDPGILGNEMLVHFPDFFDVVSMPLMYDDLNKARSDEKSQQVSDYGLDHLMLNLIELEDIQIQPLILSFSDGIKIIDESIREDFIQQKGSVRLSRENLLTALGYVNLMRWINSPVPRINVDTIGNYLSDWQLLLIELVSLLVYMPTHESIHNFTPLPPYLNPIVTSVVFGQDTALLYWLERGSDINDLREDECTPLLMLSAFGHVKGVRKLLNNSADVNRANRAGITPAMMAAYYGRELTVQCLIDHSSDLKLKDASGWTALMCAAQYTVDQNDYDHRYEIYKTKTKIIRLLLQNGAEIPSESERDKLSTLSCLCIDHVQDNVMMSEGEFVNFLENKAIQSISEAFKLN